MYQIQANNQFDFKIEINSDEIIVDDKKIDLDIAEISENKFHIIYENKSYNLEIISKDLKNKTFEILVNGNKYELKAQDELDLMLAKLGFDQSENEKISEIKSPMPGLVLRFIAEEGQTVEKGDPVLVLESMKMENVLKSPGAGTIQKITCKVGETVEKNQTLIRF